MSVRPKTEISGSIVWAGVAVIALVLAFVAFLIAANRGAELQRMLVLIGQGAIGAVNIWAVYRSSKIIGNKADENREVAREIKQTVEDVQQTVNGNTPPGGFPAADPAYKPEH